MYEFNATNQTITQRNIIRDDAQRPLYVQVRTHHLSNEQTNRLAYILAVLADHPERNERLNIECREDLLFVFAMAGHETIHDEPPLCE